MYLITLFFFILFPIFGIFSEEIHNLPVYDLQEDRYTIHKELENFSGEKLLLVNFTSSHCKPCKLEIPKLLEMQKKYQSQLVLWIVFVGDSNEKILEIKESLGIGEGAKIFKDPLEISFKRLKFSAVPGNFLIAKDKTLVYKSLGYTEAKVKELEKMIQKKLQ